MIPEASGTPFRVRIQEVSQPGVVGRNTASTPGYRLSSLQDEERGDLFINANRPQDSGDDQRLSPATSAAIFW